MAGVHDAVEDGVGQCRVVELGVPCLHRQLAGDQRRARADAVVKQFKQVVAFGCAHGCNGEVVDHQQVRAWPAAPGAARSCRRRAPPATCRTGLLPARIAPRSRCARPGVPSAGDRFMVAPTTYPAANNGNLLRLDRATCTDCEKPSRAGLVGASVGATVGAWVGACVGTCVGACFGAFFGAFFGACVGAFFGACVVGPLRVVAHRLVGGGEVAPPNLVLQVDAWLARHHHNQLPSIS